jgi:hypothetical protein
VIVFSVIPGHRAAMNPEPMNTDCDPVAEAPADQQRRLCSWVPGLALRAIPE